MKNLILIRGLPGAGKTTLAKKYVDNLVGKVWAYHVEADHFFETDGQYQFDPKRLPTAHTWCLNKARQALVDDRYQVVIVSNTFTTWGECLPYVSAAVNRGVPITIIDVLSQYKSVHGVPEKTLFRMANRWVPADLIAHKALQLGATVKIEKVK